MQVRHQSLLLVRMCTCSTGMFPCFYNVRCQKSDGGLEKAIDAEVCL